MYRFKLTFIPVQRLDVPCLCCVLNNVDELKLLSIERKSCDNGIISLTDILGTNVDEEALKLRVNATEMDEYIEMCSEMGTGDETVVEVPPEGNAVLEKVTDNSANLVRKLYI